MHSSNTGASSPVLTILLSTLAILTVVYLAWPLWLAFLPLEVDSNEAWAAHFADAFLSVRALYPDPDDLIGNNYPPLSYYLVSAISAIFGLDALFIGRLLALLATVSTGLAVRAVILQLGGTQIGGAVGALC